MKKIIEKFVDGCVGIVNKYLPDAFIFASLLTFVVFIFAIIVMFNFKSGQVNVKGTNAADPTTGITFIGRLSALLFNGWYAGFWTLNGFAMQMSLIIVTGSIFANTPQIKKFMSWLARIPKTPGQAVAFEAFFSIFVAFFQWGAALIMSAMLAKEIAKNLPGTHFALLVACGYLGLGMWHGGFSGSIPLKLPSAAYVTGDTVFGASVIPFKYTLFAPFNLFNYIGGMIILPLVAWGLHPKGDKVVVCDPSVLVEEEVKEVVIPRSEMKPNEKLNNSVVIAWIMSIIGFLAIIVYFYKLIGKPFTLDIDFVNFLFLFIAMALYGKPNKLVDAVTESASGAAGVMLQFPFYGGISGLMTYAGGANATAIIGQNKSLAAIVSNAFVSISNMTTYPLLTFYSAGIINFFIPSGGGQWAVQGPIVMPAAHKKALVNLGYTFSAAGTSTSPEIIAAGAAATLAGKKPVDGIRSYLESKGQLKAYDSFMGKSALALAWGDSWTNLIQPFWALPLLAIAKLEAKDIMGYCVLSLIILGVWCSLGFIIF